MHRLQKVPFVTLTLALLITIIQILRSSGVGGYGEVVFTNLNVVSWESLYKQPWRILTSPFLHHDMLHFLQNLGFLLLFGWQIERTYGRAIMLGVFLGGLVTSYVIWINVMHGWIIGISGGVCGLFGFSLIANRRTPWWTTLTHRPLHALYSANLLLAVIIDLANWVPYPIAHLAHLVGILYGMGFGWAFLLSPRSVLRRGVVIGLPILLFASQFYSPWQVEWRLVNKQILLETASTNCRLQSITQETYIPASITFVNTSNKPVAIYWLDYEGEASFQLWLKPGSSSEYNSFVGHPWCIVDVDSGGALQAAIVTEPEQTFAIR